MTADKTHAQIEGAPGSAHRTRPAGSALGNAPAKARLGAMTKLRSLLERGFARLRRAGRRLIPTRRNVPLRHALAAQGRGNAAAAFALLEEALAGRPDDEEAAEAFWGAAVDSERAEEAAPAMARLIERRAASDPQLAADNWTDLSSWLPGIQIDAGALARMVPVLRERLSAEKDSKRKTAARARLMYTLRQAVNPANGDLSAGMALRLAEQAREIDPQSAVGAARLALASEDLHEVKRRHLESLIEELEGLRPRAIRAVPTNRSEPSTQADAAQSPGKSAAPDDAGLSDSEVEALSARLPPSKAIPTDVAEPIELEEPERSAAASAPADLAGGGPEDLPEPPAPASSPLPVVDPLARSSSRSKPATRPPATSQPPDQARRKLKVMEGSPTALSDHALALDFRGRRKASIEFKSIQALAVARIGDPDADHELVIDLVVNWSQSKKKVLRLIRLRGDQFDARMVMLGEADSTQALRSLLGEILERSGAVPLPDPDSALGIRIRAFATLADYEREVLHVGS